VREAVAPTIPRVTTALLFQHRLRRQIVGTSPLKHSSHENSFIPHPRNGDNSSGFGLLLNCGKCRYGYGDGRERRVFLHTFIGNDSSGRHSEVDMELNRAQQHLRYSRPSQRALGLWNSQSGGNVHAHIQYCWIVSVLLRATWGMLRYGRHGYSRERDADTDPTSYSYAVRFSHSRSDSYSDSYSHTWRSYGYGG
jgi:hypothetical protein